MIRPASRFALMTGKRLPYDAEVEYLESTGTQWIDTGIVPTSDLAYQVVAAVQTYLNSRVVAGGRGSSSPMNQRILQYTQNNVRQLCLQRGDSTIRIAIPYNSDFHVFFSSATTLRIDGTEAASNAVSDSGEESFFALFGNSVAGVAQSFSACRISSAKLWRGSTLVRDYIPVRVGTTGYLYDRVSGALFGNAGTGAFSYGNDLPYPIGG